MEDQRYCPPLRVGVLGPSHWLESHQAQYDLELDWYTSFTCSDIRWFRKYLETDEDGHGHQSIICAISKGSPPRRTSGAWPPATTLSPWPCDSLTHTPTQWRSDKYNLLTEHVGEAATVAKMKHPSTKHVNTSIDCLVSLRRRHSESEPAPVAVIQNSTSSYQPTYLPPYLPTSP